MSQAMTADQMVSALQRWKIPFVEHSGPGWHDHGAGWRTHNRAGHGSFGDMHGIVQHHTGDDHADRDDLKVLWNGRADLAGPLVQAGNDDTGTLHLVGWGRCNHAGGGDPDVLRAVRDEDYDHYPPATHFHQDSPGAADGNAYFYGLENMYSGGHVMTPAQYVTAVLYSAAISEHHQWGPKSTIGHKEWSDWKPDPAHVDMRLFRRDVAEALDAGPGAWPKASTMATIHHKVKAKPGDTGLSIAAANSITPKKLLRLNPHLVKPGDVLRVG